MNTVYIVATVVFIKPIINGKADIVGDRLSPISKRYCHSCHVKMLLERLGSWIIRIFSGTIKDTASGFALSRDAMHPRTEIFFGDIILITTDKKHARTVTYTVKEHRPLPTLDYGILTTFDDVIYFERKMNELDITRNCQRKKWDTL